jgi:hypothetical protein
VLNQRATRVAVTGDHVENTLWQELGRDLGLPRS